MTQRYIVDSGGLSYTGDTYTSPNLPIFYSGAEFELQKTMGREVVENLIKQQIVLYQIDTVNTESNFYGESKKKNWKVPVTLTARVQYGDKDVILEGGIRKQRRREITVYIYSDHMVELGLVDINIGDYFKYRNRFYEVYGNIGQGNRMGVERPFYRVFRAHYVEPTTFSGA